MRASILMVSLLGFTSLTACGGGAAKKNALPKPSPSASPAAKVGGGHALALIESRSESTVAGTANFTAVEGGVLVEVEINGATPGTHGIHLHETGDCSAPDAASAGGHFNPDKMNHGGPAAPPHHGGDLGNIEVGADGTGKLTLTLQGLTISPGDYSVVGRAIVVHADADDLATQPSGNSGKRQGCGVINFSE